MSSTSPTPQEAQHKTYSSFSSFAAQLFLLFALILVIPLLILICYYASKMMTVRQNGNLSAEGVPYPARMYDLRQTPQSTDNYYNAAFHYPLP
jgi:hypothetical protein